MVCRLLDAQPILQIVILIWRLCMFLRNIVTIMVYIIKAYIPFWYWLHMYATIFLFFNNTDNKLHPIFRSHPTMYATRDHINDFVDCAAWYETMLTSILVHLSPLWRRNKLVWFQLVSWGRNGVGELGYDTNSSPYHLVPGSISLGQGGYQWRWFSSNWNFQYRRAEYKHTNMVWLSFFIARGYH